MANRGSTDPGLDRIRLAALRRPRPGTEQLRERIRAHLDVHDGYVAFSGGKDSLVTLHLALSVEPNVPVAFFDSGLEFPETYTYLEQMRRHLDLQLHRIAASRTTLEVLIDSGRWDHHAPAVRCPTCTRS
jgi:phosphoadenosine phosphosulfate reductase